MQSTTLELTYLLGSDGALGGLVQLLNGLGVVTQILLATNQDNGEALAEVENLGDPLKKDRVSMAPTTKQVDPVHLRR